MVSLSSVLSLFCKLAVLVRHRISLFGKVLSVCAGFLSLEVCLALEAVCLSSNSIRPDEISSLSKKI